VNIEIVVAGPLGDLARWALADLQVERRQVLLTSSTDMLGVLDHLTIRAVEVLAVRERQHPGDLGEAGPTAIRHR
jgi:hypothetical protein